MFVVSVALKRGCYWTIMPVVMLTHINVVLALNSLNKSVGDVEEWDKHGLL